MCQNSVVRNTANLYQNAVSTFENFRYQYNLPRLWPPSMSDVINCVAFLAKFKCSPSTAKSYMSGISFYLKMNGFHDITDSFIFKKMLKGIQRLEKRGDCRKPITLDLLSNIVQILPHIAFSTYEVALFSAAFTLACFCIFKGRRVCRIWIICEAHIVS